MHHFVLDYSMLLPHKRLGVISAIHLSENLLSPDDVSAPSSSRSSQDAQPSCRDSTFLPNPHDLAQKASVGPGASSCFSASLTGHQQTAVPDLTVDVSER